MSNIHLYNKELLKKEKEYQIWDSFFNLSEELLSIKKVRCLFGFAGFTSLGLIYQDNQLKIEVYYSWYQESKKKNTAFVFSNHLNAIDFMNYYEAQILKKPLFEIIDLLNNKNHQKILSQKIDLNLWLSTDKESFKNQKNIYLDETLLIAHEAYTLEQKMNQLDKSSVKKSMTKIKI
jgi:hypothetical protein